MSDINYHDKYLKYKKKYLDLLNKFYGGSNTKDAKDEAKPVPKTAAEADKLQRAEKLEAATQLRVKGTECKQDLDCKEKELFCTYGYCEPRVPQGQLKRNATSQRIKQEIREFSMTDKEKRQEIKKDLLQKSQEEKKKADIALNTARAAQNKAKSAPPPATKSKYNYEFDVNELLSESSVN